MRAANLIYNGVTLALVKTNQIAAEPIYSDDGIDYLYTKYTINIDAILNPQETSYAIGSPPVQFPGILPNTTYIAIRHSLMQPRAQLIFRNFGLNVFQSPENGAIIDANLGPFPKSFNVSRLDGGKLWHVNYVIETYIANCPAGNSLALLSNRFSQSQTIDREFYTTTTTRGYAHFRTDVLVNQGVVADAFRSELLPPVPPQFRRESMEFGVNTRGNTIEYTITDKEVKLDLGNTGPTGSGTFITNMEGFYNLSSISAAPDGGGEAIPTGMSMATMNVKLWGSRQASNWDLTQLAFQAMVANGKISIGLKGEGADAQGGIVHHFSITQSLEQNFVDVTISVKQTAVKNGMFGGMNVAGLKKDNFINEYGGICPTPPNDNMTRGDQSVLLISSLSTALQQACTEPSRPLAATGGGGMAPPNYQGPPPVVTVYPTDRIPSAPTKYSTPTTEYPYSESKIDSYYNTDKGRWHVPQSGKKQEGSYTPGGGTPPPEEGPGLPAGRMSPTSSIIDLHLPISTRVVNWSVERYGAKPKIPAFESENPALALLDYKINLAEVIVMLDGVTPSFRVTGRYEYAITREISSFESVAFDIPQFIDYPYGEITLNFPSEDSSEGGDFSQGIIGDSSQGNMA